jgi:lysophospholipase L1-like esterase
LNDLRRAVLNLAIAAAALVLLSRSTPAWWCAALGWGIAGIALARSPNARARAVAPWLPLAVLAALAIDVVAFPRTPYPRRLLLFLALPPLAALIASFGTDARGVRLGLARGALALLSAIGFLGLVEAVLSHAVPADLYAMRTLPGSSTDRLYLLGGAADRMRHSYASGFRGVFMHPEFAGVEFVTNSDGFRDVEWPGAPLPDTTSIVVVGDSCAAGVGVPLRQAFPALLEVRLGERAEAGSVRVYNAAVAGHGPGDQLLVLEDVAERLDPAIVIATFYDGNDLDDLRFEIDRERRRAGEVVGKGGRAAFAVDPVDPLEWSYWHRTALWRSFGERASLLLLRFGWIEPRAIYTMRMLRAMWIGGSDAELAEDVERGVQAFRRIASLCAGRGAHLLVVRLPARVQTDPRQFQAMLDGNGLDAQSFDRTLPGRTVVERLRKDGIDVVDLLPLLEVDDEASPYYFVEGHPSAAGHARIADAVADALLARGKISGPR